MARKKANKGAVSVNFKGVEVRKNIPVGDYLATCISAVTGVSSKDNKQLEFMFEIAEGPNKGGKLYYYCTLTDTSLWKLAGLLTAMGEEVPDGPLEIDLEELVGKEIVAIVGEDKYDGKVTTKMVDAEPVEDGDSSSDDDDDDKPAPKAKGKKKPAADDDDDDDDKPVAKKDKKKPAADDDDDDEPAPKAKGKAKKAKKVAKSAVLDMDEDELQELLDEHKLEDEVDLDDFKTLKKKAAAVIDALEEADLLDDDD